jgi:hypothetical protein
LLDFDEPLLPGNGVELETTRRMRRSWWGGMGQREGRLCGVSEQRTRGTVEVVRDTVDDGVQPGRPFPREDLGNPGITLADRHGELPGADAFLLQAQADIATEPVERGAGHGERLYSNANSQLTATVSRGKLADPHRPLTNGSH